ncbi:MAG: hypothetical protein A3E01_02605 [Gammaproteobacteria bacterium RIFCSPHIGHO2_12_FULL_63_22]|nr:MAG: hypothetical protein A3E01_02605 [Gammaproteobacteria bacterium RIFCSPHIGHO2_12_FULL_63_22]
MSLVEWAIGKGRAAIFAECGLGKTPMQLVWAENVIRHTNKPVLLVTPIAVGSQAEREAVKFGIEAKRTRDGKMAGDKCIWITNYEQLHKYDPAMFGGCVCDESSAIKDFKTDRKKVVVEFMRTIPYRLLCTATAAPNDYWELGTSSEALGYLGYRDMLTHFFKEEVKKDYLGWGRTKYRFRGHAEQPFWQWVCSWARSLRNPSDLGFDDSRFALPDLIEHEIVVKLDSPRNGLLFDMPASDMREERAERRRTIKERCERAAAIANECTDASVVWCDLNPEGDLLESLLDDCVQVKGSMSDQAKEEALQAFSFGQIRQMVIKPKIGAWGLNWQHCANVVEFPTHSFEQHYQLVRRCHRFGQTRPVHVSSVICDSEQGIVANRRRKANQVDTMFTSIVRHMGDELHLVSHDNFPVKEDCPAWL